MVFSRTSLGCNCGSQIKSPARNSALYSMAMRPVRWTPKEPMTIGETHRYRGRDTGRLSTALMGFVHAVHGVHVPRINDAAKRHCRLVHVIGPRLYGCNGRSTVFMSSRFARVRLGFLCKFKVPHIARSRRGMPSRIMYFKFIFLLFLSSAVFLICLSEM